MLEDSFDDDTPNHHTKCIHVYLRDGERGKSHSFYSIIPQNSEKKTERELERESCWFAIWHDDVDDEDDDDEDGGIQRVVVVGCVVVLL